MSTTITALVTNVERAGTTVNGNTVKRVTLSVADDGRPGVVEMLTARDSAIALEIENQEYRDIPHIFTLNRALRIQSAIPAGI